MNAKAFRSASGDQPLLGFLCDTLLRSGCELLNVDGDRPLPPATKTTSLAAAVSISADMVRATLERGRHSRLREGSEERDFDFAEALVGFRRDRLYHYVLFERIAEGLDTPYRERLAQEFLDVTRRRRPAG